MDCIVIPAGWFLMGSADGRDDERPVHRVWVDEFKMARYQVTNRDYQLFLEDTKRRPPPFWGQSEFSHPDQPVVGVTWEDAVAYCAWLGPGYRLPTEAEWEKAARSGLEGKTFPWGDEDPTTRPNYRDRWKTGPEPVGAFEPNAYGLYDICENVHEWCLDWYDPAFYARSPERNPCSTEPKPAQGAGRLPAGAPAPVLATGRRASRGGSWRHHIKIARSAARSHIPPSFAYADYGFRVAKGALHG